MVLWRQADFGLDSVPNDDPDYSGEDRRWYGQLRGETRLLDGLWTTGLRLFRTENRRRYANLPDATAKTLTADGWLRTGDAGYLDADGYVYIHDRVKDMIITGGENVYPAEVENAIFDHPAVADVAVIGVPDPKWGEAVKACVVRRPGVECTEADILTHARARIAGFKTPKSVDFIDALPRNPSGKILRRELRAPYWEGRERQVN